jgi:hypothetical protein
MNTPGWWVPVSQYWRQTLLPRDGCWQTVRTADGTVHQALILAGAAGWRDGNYNEIPGVTEWLKPAMWFASADDLVGDTVKMSESRRRSVAA